MKKRHLPGKILLSLLCALEILALTHIAAAFMLKASPVKLAFVLAAVGFAASLVLRLRVPKAARALTIAVTALFIAAGAALAAVLAGYSASAVYAGGDDGKANLFAGKRVLLVVPHQDDELNLMCGAIDEYLRYGSEVYVMYVTNGDNRVPAEQRLNEALAAVAVCGIDEEHVIFLGYGDWCLTADGVPLYNADGVVESKAGHTATYALAGHPPFRGGREYTRENVLEDIRDAVLEYAPDVIYAVDCDMHPDHIMTSLLFDRAMGEIVAAGSGYEPLVYKGMAYSTAYTAPGDFYALNIGATADPGGGLRAFAPGTYDWAARFRLPVSASSLSRSLWSSSSYQAASRHNSQDEDDRSTRAINGDKVFWRRETGSISYAARVTASSGDAALLTDFVLADTGNASAPADNVTGVWRPEAADEAPAITFTFDTPQTVYRVKLYDDPDPAANVLAARIEFDDGSSVDVTALDPLGAETEIITGRENVRSFTVHVTEYEGAAPGLTEAEVYSAPFDPAVSYVKIMNAAGDFAYDYRIDPSGRESFSLYAYGCSGDIAGYTITCEGDDCRAYVENGALVVECPAGARCRVTVSDGENGDAAYFENTGSSGLPYGMQLEINVRGKLYKVQFSFLNIRRFAMSVMQRI